MLCALSYVGRFESDAVSQCQSRPIAAGWRPTTASIGKRDLQLNRHELVALADPLALENCAIGEPLQQQLSNG